MRRKDRAPEALGGGGHLDVADAERGAGVGEGVGDRGEGADIAGFARTLDAERVGLRRTGLLSQWITERSPARDTAEWTEHLDFGSPAGSFTRQNHLNIRSPFLCVTPR